MTLRVTVPRSLSKFVFGELVQLLVLVLGVLAVAGSVACTRSAPSTDGANSSNLAVRFANRSLMKATQGMTCDPWTGRETAANGPDSALCSLGAMQIYVLAPDDKKPTWEVAANLGAPAPAAAAAPAVAPAAAAPVAPAAAPAAPAPAAATPTAEAPASK